MNIIKELKEIKAKLASIDSDVKSELKRNEDKIFDALEKTVLGSNRLLLDITAKIDQDHKGYGLNSIKGKNYASNTTISEIFSKFSSKFKNLEESEQYKTQNEFLKSFNKLPIEDVIVKCEGDFEGKIADVQAFWVVTANGLDVKIDEKQLKGLIEEL